MTQTYNQTTQCPCDNKVCMYAISYTHPSPIYHALMHEGPFPFRSIHWEQSGVDTVQPMRNYYALYGFFPTGSHQQGSPHCRLKRRSIAAAKLCFRRQQSEYKEKGGFVPQVHWMPCSDSRRLPGALFLCFGDQQRPFGI